MSATIRIGLAGAVTLAVVLLGATRAEASVEGPCQAVADISPAATASSSPAPARVDVRTSEVIEVPDAGTVVWFGQIGDGQTTEPRRAQGEIDIVLPPVLDGLVGGLAMAYSWSGDDVTTAQGSGTETYQVPSFVPAGAEIVVAGSHTDTLGTCAGSVTLKLAGNPITQPVTIAMVVVTVAVAVPLVLAGRA